MALCQRHGSVRATETYQLFGSSTVMTKTSPKMVGRSGYLRVGTLNKAAAGFNPPAPSPMGVIGQGSKISGALQLIGGAGPASRAAPVDPARLAEPTSQDSCKGSVGPQYRRCTVTVAGG